MVAIFFSRRKSKEMYIYILLTEFKVRTVMLRREFSRFRVNHARAINQRKKRGSVTYSTDRENEISKRFNISLRLIGGAGKEQLSNLTRRTVKYGPQKWLITPRLLPERYNKYICYIYLDVHSKKKALWLVDSWLRAPDQIQMYPDRDTIPQLLPSQLFVCSVLLGLLKGKSKYITKHLMYGPSGN